MADKTFKERLRSGEHLFGFSCPMTLAREQFKRVIDALHYDFVFTDSQHAAFDEFRLVEFCQMATEFGLPVRFRPPHARHAYMCGHYLDLGPTGIEIPQVNSEDTVRDAVENFYYPPIGNRSWGGGARHRIAEFADMRAYADWWNTYGVLWLQVESAWTTLHAALLAKAGVDCFSFGPSDLTFDLEQHGDTGLRTVDDCVAFVARTLAGSNVRLSFRIGGRGNMKKYADMGVSVFLESMPEI